MLTMMYRMFNLQTTVLCMFLLMISHVVSAIDTCQEPDISSGKPYKLSIEETAPAGTGIFSIAVSGQERWTFKLESSDIDISGISDLRTYLELKLTDDKKYEMTLVKPFDLEKIFQDHGIKLNALTLILTCKRTGFPDQMSEIFIAVQPVNEFSPEFIGVPLQQTVLEDTKVGTEIFILSSRTLDLDVNPSTNELAHFDVQPYLPNVKKDGQSYFEMQNKVTGNIVLKTALDYEKMSPINSTQLFLNVSASDVHGLTSYTTLIIDIKDVDDLPPEFYHPSCPIAVAKTRPCLVAYEASVPVNFQGQITDINPALVQARDMDSLDYKIKFSLEQGPGEQRATLDKFFINETTGDILVMKPLTAETEAHLVIVATEVSQLARATQASLDVLVTDPNNNDESDGENDQMSVATIVFLSIVTTLSVLVIFLLIALIVMYMTIGRASRKVGVVESVTDNTEGSKPASSHSLSQHERPYQQPPPLTYSVSEANIDKEFVDTSSLKKLLEDQPEPNAELSQNISQNQQNSAVVQYTQPALTTPKEECIKLNNFKLENCAQNSIALSSHLVKAKKTPDSLNMVKNDCKRHQNAAPTDHRTNTTHKDTLKVHKSTSQKVCSRPTLERNAVVVYELRDSYDYDGADGSGETTEEDRSESVSQNPDIQQSVHETRSEILSSDNNVDGASNEEDTNPTNFSETSISPDAQNEAVTAPAGNVDVLSLMPVDKASSVASDDVTVKSLMSDRVIPLTLTSISNQLPLMEEEAVSPETKGNSAPISTNQPCIDYQHVTNTSSKVDDEYDKIPTRDEDTFSRSPHHRRKSFKKRRNREDSQLMTSLDLSLDAESSVPSSALIDITKRPYTTSCNALREIDTIVQAQGRPNTTSAHRKKKRKRRKTALPDINDLHAEMLHGVRVIPPKPDILYVDQSKSHHLAVQEHEMTRQRIGHRELRPVTSARVPRQRLTKQNLQQHQHAEMVQGDQNPSVGNSKHFNDQRVPIDRSHRQPYLLLSRYKQQQQQHMEGDYTNSELSKLPAGNRQHSPVKSRTRQKNVNVDETETGSSPESNFP